MAHLSALFHAIISLFLQHLLYMWLQYNVIMTFWQNWKIWRSLETYFMIETAEFFSFHFIALSRPPPSWTGCSQTVKPLVLFDHSTHLCKNSPEGALCMQLSIFIPSFDGFASRRPLLVHHLLARGHCPLSSVFSAVRQFLVQSNWLQECPVDGAICHIFPVKRFLLRICNSTPLSG